MEGRADRADADLVRAVGHGDHGAFAELFDRWFGRVWSVAYHILYDAELASEVAQECLLVAWQQLDSLREPDAFGGWLLRIGRNRSLSRLGQERRTHSLDGDAMTRLGDGAPTSPTAADPALVPEQVAETRDRQELVWVAAAALGQRDWSLLDLHLRHGLAAPELAEELGIKVNNAHQLLHRLRAKLATAIGAYLLWRHGRASCRELGRLVANRPTFDRATAKTVTSHRSSCVVCDQRHRALTDPEQLLAAVPLLLPRPELAARAASDLAATGVPLTGTGSTPSVSSPAVNGRPGVDDGGSDASGGPVAGGGSDAGTGSGPSEVSVSGGGRGRGGSDASGSGPGPTGVGPGAGGGSDAGSGPAPSRARRRPKAAKPGPVGGVVAALAGLLVVAGIWVGTTAGLAAGEGDEQVAAGGGDASTDSSPAPPPDPARTAGTVDPPGDDAGLDGGPLPDDGAASTGVGDVEPPPRSDEVGGVTEPDPPAVIEPAPGPGVAGPETDGADTVDPIGEGVVTPDGSAGSGPVDPAAPEPDGRQPEQPDPDPGRPDGREPDPQRPGDGEPEGGEPVGREPGGGDPAQPPLVPVGPAALVAEPQPEPTLTFSVDLSGAGMACNRLGELEWDISWRVHGATTAVTSTFDRGDRRSAPVAGDDTGRTTFCARPDTAYTIVATAGTATATHQGSTPPADEPEQPSGGSLARGPETLAP